MTQHIQTKFVQPVEFISQTESSSAMQKCTSETTSTSSLRTSMRRMRTETTTSSSSTTDSEGKIYKELEILRDKFVTSFTKGRYADALAILANLETISDDLLQRAEFIVEHLVKGQFSQTKAYFQALMKNPDAIANCDTAFEQLQAATANILKIARDMGAKEYVNKKLQKVLEQEHLLYRGFIKLSLGQREEAIKDLQSSVPHLFNSYEQSSDYHYRYSYFKDVESAFLFRILEIKLETTLLAVPTSLDDSDPMSLFLAGKYEAALQVIDARRNVDSKPLSEDWFQHIGKPSYDFALKAACLALQGQTKEALRLVKHEATSYDGDPEIMASLIHLLSGDVTAARKKYPFEGFDKQFLVPLPILSDDNNIQLPEPLILLAIRGFEGN